MDYQTILITHGDLEESLYEQWAVGGVSALTHPKNTRNSDPLDLQVPRLHPRIIFEINVSIYLLELRPWVELVKLGRGTSQYRLQHMLNPLPVRYLPHDIISR